jgi:hypothetical protein
MAQLVIPTNGAVGIPLLIEEKNLFALDKVFGDFVDGLKAANRSGFERSVIIYLSGGRTVKADSFADAIKQPHLTDEEPLGFRAHLAVNEIKASVSLTRLYPTVVQPVSPTQSQTTQQTPQLEFNVEPSEEQAAQELFGALQNWASEFAPSTWMRRWARYTILFTILLIIWAVGGLMLGIFDLQIPNETYYAEQAHQILQKGVNDDNQHKAIEVILAIVAKDPPPSRSVLGSKPGRKYWSICVGVAVALFSLSLCPSIVIGIWKGKPKLARWRAWIKWMWVTVPTLLIGSVLLPAIIHMARS